MSQEKTLTDNEIKKALEEWIKNYEGTYGNFRNLGNALDLINRQEEEKESLKAEVERLQNTLDDILDRQPILVERSEKYAKAEAYKEFAEKVNNIIESLIETYSIKDFEEFKAICQILRSLKNDTNNLLNELVGES